MTRDQLKPNIIIQGPVFPEPVQVITIVPMGESIKLIGKGLSTGKVHEPILNNRPSRPVQGEWLIWRHSEKG